jgi:hypothetical protein
LGHYQKDCPTAPPAASAAAEDSFSTPSSVLSATELAAFRRLLAGAAPRARAALAVGGFSDPLTAITDDDSEQEA